MSNCAIVGINWGDEGKGRMVDLVTADYDVVVRYQGGGNAGHTVVNEFGKFALHLLPSGIFRKGVVNILGNGVALDCESLWTEMSDVMDQGVAITPENLKISDRASLLLPWHRDLDSLEEARLADKKYGSTKQGIAPFYSDKYQKKTIQAGELLYPEHLKALKENGIGAFADTFQDLHGLKQLPGIAAQNLMAKGIGFGPEGDYKISALSAVLMKMSEGKEGATGFIEDYTYDLTQGQELELASHMLEVPPAFAATKPEIDVIPLGIGGKEDPARLIFDGVTGDGIQVTMVDMGDHFRIICADIELVKQPKPMPKLPVARIMYRHKPNFQIGTAAWCYAGGAHHSVVSTALTRDDIAMFARLTGTELITIGEDTTEADLQKFFMK